MATNPEEDLLLALGSYDVPRHSIAYVVEDHEWQTVDGERTKIPGLKVYLKTAETPYIFLSDWTREGFRTIYNGAPF